MDCFTGKNFISYITYIHMIYVYDMIQYIILLLYVHPLKEDGQPVGESAGMVVRR